MTRFRFILAAMGFGAIAKGQEMGIERHRALRAPIPDPDSEDDRKWKNGKPLNNQCPVCGTMAEAFHAENDCLEYAGPPVQTGDVLSLTCSKRSTHPANRMLRCSRCNNCFWQDAEAEK